MANAATLKPLKPQVRTAPEDISTPAPTPVFAMLSHRGRVRHANQDACAALPEHGVFVVCDGMGGAAGGEIASQLASDAFLHALTQPAPRAHRRIPADPAPHSLESAAGPYPANHPHTRLAAAVHAANNAVFRHSRKSPRLHGMGTTLVALLLEASAQTLWLAHVGDSRCYRLRRGVLHQLTRDHSLVEEQVGAGLLSRIQAVASPFRNIITRAIGTQSTVEPEIASHPTQPGDLYLLASDGLTREVDDGEILAILARTSTSALDAACQALVDAANAHGGRDNVTVLLVACP
jgi:protein phosphatase